MLRVTAGQALRRNADGVGLPSVFRALTVGDLRYESGGVWDSRRIWSMTNSQMVGSGRSGL